MTPNEYQKLAISTQADQTVILNRLYSDPEYGPRAMQLDNAARGLADDSGEVSGCIKKWIEYGQPLDLVNLKEEVGDCLWRIIQVCDAAGFTLEDVMVANLEKLKVRYKDGYSDAQAAEENRDRIAEREVISSRTVRVGQGISQVSSYEQAIALEKQLDTPFQTGQGWAEPPEELPVQNLPPSCY